MSARLRRQRHRVAVILADLIQPRPPFAVARFGLTSAEDRVSKLKRWMEDDAARCVAFHLVGDSLARVAIGCTSSATPTYAPASAWILFPAFWFAAERHDSLVRFASSRPCTPAVLFFNDSRGLSLSR
jgi:hypothetical protein